MSDIFVSYSRNDRGRVAEIVEKLEKNGWSVWWDPDIMPGERYAQTIDSELKNAKCVVAIWSESSATSDWVHEEAEDGKTRGILLPILVDDIPIPRGFRRIQTADLSDWRGGEKDPAWAYVAAAAKRFITGGPAPAIKPPKTRRQKRSALITNTLSVIALALIAGGVWWGAAHPAQLTQITQNNTFIQTIVNVFTGGGAGTQTARGGARGENEPNDTPAQATQLALGRAASGEISEDADVDYYRVETTGGPRNVITFRLDNAGAELRPDMTIFNADGSQIERAYDTTPGANVERTFMAPPNTVFLVSVARFSLGLGAYRLTVSNDATHAAAARVRNGTPEREPNDQSLDAQEIAWGRPVLGHAHREGDADYYTATAPANGPANAALRLRSFSSAFRPNLTLYDGNRQQIADHYSTTPGSDLVAQFEPTSGATYYFRVQTFSTGEGDYVLEVGVP